MTTMAIEQIPDWERRIARQDAFWECAIIDRPVVTMSVAAETPAAPMPSPKQWASVRERWLDAEYVAERALAGVLNTEYLGDALPCTAPNLGPEVFSAFFGAELEFGDTTSWSIPNLTDWADADKLQFSEDSFYWQAILQMTDVFLKIGWGHFYTGIIDLHPGGDAVAAFRDPVNLNLDMIEHPAEVKALVDRVTDDYLHIFDALEGNLRAASQPVSSWPGIVSTRKWYVPSNDFSCMISKQMFDDIFLPGLIRECQHMEASVYHLDGPGALRHLDSLLDIPELNAIQWVYGAGNGRASDWMHVYKRCQQAGKGLQIGLDVSELDFFMENLHPEGLWIGLGGIRSREHADEILRKVKKWK